MVYCAQPQDCVSCIQAYSPSQLFDFHSGQMQQYTWTVLSQGFQDSPHLVSQALRKQLWETHLKERAILQYVHDILICTSPWWSQIQIPLKSLISLGLQSLSKVQQISK